MLAVRYMVRACALMFILVGLFTYHHPHSWPPNKYQVVTRLKDIHQLTTKQSANITQAVLDFADSDPASGNQTLAGPGPGITQSREEATFHGDHQVGHSSNRQEDNIHGAGTWPDRTRLPRRPLHTALRGEVHQFTAHSRKKLDATTFLIHQGRQRNIDQHLGGDANLVHTSAVALSITQEPADNLNSLQRKHDQKVSNQNKDEPNLTLSPTNYSEDESAGLYRMSQMRRPTASRLYSHLSHLLGDAEIEFYILGAYLDEREGVGRAVVRVNSVSEQTNKTIYCLLWTDGVEEPATSVAIPVPAGPSIPRHGKQFTSYIYTCNLGSTIPQYVSMLTADVKTARNLVPVQKPARASTRKQLIVCVSVSYGDVDPYRLVEWLELHRLLGVSVVSIYNSSISQQAGAVLRHYQKEGFVELHQAPVLMSDEGELTTLLSMSPTINDCMYRHLYQFEHVLVVDLDEVVIPRQHSTYQEMLAFLKHTSISHHTVAPSYAFYNVYFFLDLPPTVTGALQFMTTTRYRRHVEISPIGYSTKCITDLRTCVALQNHYCWHRLPAYNTSDWLLAVDDSLARNHHYKPCHFDEFLNAPGICQKLMQTHYVDDVINRYKDVLTANVSKKLKTLYLL